MSSPRFFHAAVALPGGKVFVTGGCGGTAGVGIAPGTPGFAAMQYTCSDPQVTSAEIFDPAGGNWQTVSNSSSIRNNPQAALIPGKAPAACGANCGNVLVADTADKAADVFSPKTGKWKSVGKPKYSDGILLSLTGGGSECGKACGKVLAVGRTSSGDSIAQLFEPAAGKWQTAATPPVFLGLLGFTTSLLPSGEVLITGGLVEKPQADPAAEGGRANFADPAIYDPAKDKWRMLKSTGFAYRSGHSATVLKDGRVLVAGGTKTLGNEVISSAELLDPKSSRPKPIRSMAQARRHHLAVTLPGDKVLVLGGRPNLKAGTTDELEGPPQAEIYNVSSGQWGPAGGVPQYRGPLLKSFRPVFTATPLNDGRVLVVGGVSADGKVLASAQIFRP